MRIALVAPSPVPFAVGGAEKLFMGMLHHFNRLSVHDLELIKLPCRDQEFWPLMECYRRFSRLRLDHFDAVISTKYPAWMVSHPRHILYMQHTCRGVYDLYRGEEEYEALLEEHPALEPLGAFLSAPEPDRSMLEPFFDLLFHLREIESQLPAHAFAFPGPLSRAVIRWLDRIALARGEIASYNAISRTVASREGYFPPELPVKVIYHPSPLETSPGEGGEFLFTVSRLEELKRIDLLLEAYRRVRSDLPFYIAGTGGQEERLRALAQGDERIRFLGFVSDEELAKRYAEALFIPFVPYDEDFGLITLEAMSSAKAVLTASDSGGVTEMVEEGRTGRIVAPDARELAEAMQEMVDRRQRTLQMGARGLEIAREIDWPNLVAALLGEEALIRPPSHPPRASVCMSSTPPPSAPLRRRILQLSTFPVFPPRSGGQLRIAHLARELARDAQLRTLSLGHRDEIRPQSETLTEIEVSRPMRFYRHARKLEDRTGVSSEDLALLGGWRVLDRFGEVLEAHLSRCDLVMLEGPYLEPMLRVALRERERRGLSRPRILYSAHNVEYLLKKALYRSDREAERIRAVEERLCREADLLLACTQEDARWLQELYLGGEADASKLLVVPNGIDVASVEIPDAQERRRIRQRLGFDGPVALFMGSRHAPNLEALEFVLELARLNPGVLFLVLGNVAEGLQGHPENLLPLGEVDDASKRLFLSAADIGLNPIFSGSGSNLKLMEYLAWGLVTLSTPFGMRGFDLEPERDLLLASREEFAGRLRELSRDLPRMETMRLRAREAASRYDWRSIAAPLSERIGEILSSEI